MKIYRMRVYDKFTGDLNQTQLFDTVEELLTVASIFSRDSDVHLKFDSTDVIFKEIDADAK